MASAIRAVEIACFRWPKIAHEQMRTCASTHTRLGRQDACTCTCTRLWAQTKTLTQTQAQTMEWGGCERGGWKREGGKLKAEMGHGRVD
eukprot:11343195-Alexandrium_andersonii.AAC.1